MAHEPTPADLLNRIADELAENVERCKRWRNDGSTREGALFLLGMIVGSSSRWRDWADDLCRANDERDEAAAARIVVALQMNDGDNGRELELVRAIERT